MIRYFLFSFLIAASFCIQSELGLQVVSLVNGNESWTILRHMEPVATVVINPLGHIVSQEGALCDGDARAYFDSGPVAFEVTVRKGQFNGPARAYYENGNLKWEANYKKGVLEGVQERFTTYDEIELIRSEDHDVVGELSGVSRNQKQR
jgi:antitoxin component YwqK of YwqJK toxin-antitoxin module